MPDMFDAEARSAVMAKVKSKNTSPEVTVRKMLHGMGYRFRLHRKDLPGNPDIVLPKYRLAIFVHGCFWHGHTCRHGQIRPQSNADYWTRKLDRNLERDKENELNLKNLGWVVLVVWECELKKKNIEALSKRLRDFITSLRSNT